MWGRARSGRRSQYLVQRGRLLLAALAMAMATGCGATWPGCSDEAPLRSAEEERAVVGQAIPMQRYGRRDAVAALWPRGRGIGPARPTQAERDALARLLPVLSQTPPIEFAGTPEAMALAGQAHAVGFALELWQVDAAWFWVLRERDEARRGAGAYVFRAPYRPETERAPAPLLILQAPHAYFDQRTGRIAAGMVFGSSPGRVPVDVLMTNTLHRYQQAPDRRHQEAHNPADVCHNPEHLFHHATTVIAGAAPDRQVMLVQLHGFGAPNDGDGDHDGDDDGDGRAAMGGVEVIVSAGRADGSSAASTNVARALARVLGAEAVRRYPEDIGQLGGTTNVQGRMLRERGDAAFLHIEMSAGLRKRLAAEPDRLAAFADAVLGRLDHEAP